MSEKQIDVRFFPFACDQIAKNFGSPAGSFTARRTLSARFVGVKIGDDR